MSKDLQLEKAVKAIIVNKRTTRATSFSLAALTLAACGGSEGGSDSIQFASKSGALIKGPVDGARVFVDYNGNGTWDQNDEPSTRTDQNGLYSFDSIKTDQKYDVIADLEGAKDVSSGFVYNGGKTLKSDTDASVITPLTTVLSDGAISKDQLVKTLGLDDVEGFDPMTYNPYDESVDPQAAVKVEVTAQKLMTAVESMSTVLEAAGEETSAAYSKALKAVATSVTKAAETEETFDVADKMDEIFEEVVSNVTDTEKGQKVTAVKEQVVKSVSNVVNSYDKTQSLATDGSANPEFQVVNALTDQIKAAATDGDASTLSLANDGEVDTLVSKYAENTEATLDVTTLTTSLSEATDSLVLGNVVVSDVDGDEVTLSLAGEDANAFTLTEAGELAFKSQPDYEVKSSYNVTIVADDGSEKSEKQLVIEVTDQPAPSLNTENLQTSISEGADSLNLGAIDAAGANGNEVTLSLAGTDADAFTITPEGELVLKAQPDYEVKSTYNVTIVADDGSEKSEKQLVIEITDQPGPSVGDENIKTSISEGADSLSLGSINSTDANGNGVTLSLAGADAEAFTITDAGELLLKAQPDYEVKSSYKVTIVANDGFEATNQELVINVENADIEAFAAVINVDTLDAILPAIDTDIANVEARVDAFYNDPETGANALIQGLDEQSFGNPDLGGDFIVSSSGVQLVNVDGFTLDLAFINFSPSSVDELMDTVEAFEESGDINDLTVSGGFESADLLNPNGGVILSLSHSDQGIAWRNPNAADGDVDAFVIEGNFGNQLSDYLELLNIVGQIDSGTANDTTATVMDAFDIAAGLIEVDGIVAQADGADLLSIRSDDANDSLTIAIAGSDGDHELNVSIGNSSDFVNGFIDATGGIENFVDLLLSEFYVEVYAHNGSNETYVNYYEYHGVDGIEQWSWDGATRQETSVIDYVFEEPSGTFQAPPDYSSWSNVWYSSGSNDYISVEEYNRLKTIIEDGRDYLDQTPSPVDDLTFNLSYSYDGEEVVSINAADITSLLPDFNRDTFEVTGLTDDSQTPVTVVADAEGNVNVTLVGVDSTEFNDELAANGNDYEAVIDAFLSYEEPSTLSAPEAL